MKKSPGLKTATDFLKHAIQLFGYAHLNQELIKDSNIDYELLAKKNKWELDPIGGGTITFNLHKPHSGLVFGQEKPKKKKRKKQ